MDRWILSQCTETISSVNASLTSGDFHFVTRSIRNFLYSNVCDVYLVSWTIYIVKNNKDYF